MIYKINLGSVPDIWSESIHVRYIGQLLLLLLERPGKPQLLQTMSMFYGDVVFCFYVGKKRTHNSIHIVWPFGLVQLNLLSAAGRNVNHSEAQKKNRLVGSLLACCSTLI